MLEELHLEQIVLFEDVTLPFAPGLNVISGETGAGKSLVASALSLALGARASAESIRAGSDHARVSAVFDACPRETSDPDLQAFLEDIPEDEPLILERTLHRNRASRMHIHHRPAALSLTVPLAMRLVDMSAQNEQTRLMEPAYQRVLLDRFGGHAPEAEAYAKSYRDALAVQQRILAGDEEKERNRARLDHVRYLLQRIGEVGYQEEDAHLEDRIRTLSHAESIRDAAREAVQRLHEEDGALTDSLGAIAKSLAPHATHSAPLREACGFLEESLAALDEAVRAIQTALDETDADPGELDALIERAEALKQLARRLSCTGAEIPQEEARLRAEAESLESWEADTGELVAILEAKRTEAMKRGDALHKKRTQAARRLVKAVGTHLQDLGMPEAEFSVDCVRRWSVGDDPETFLSRVHAGGVEEVSFLIRPNPGEPPSTLAEQASGGEAARAMLAIKSALAAVHAAPTLLFDEVDAGVGGRLGDVIGRKLRELSRGRQVIVITHLPQIAAYADQHLKVSKEGKDGRTVARIDVLSGKARVQEIAHMIHGDAGTKTTLRQAEEMLRLATADA